MCHLFDYPVTICEPDKIFTQFARRRAAIEELVTLRLAAHAADTLARERREIRARRRNAKQPMRRAA